MLGMQRVTQHPNMSPRPSSRERDAVHRASDAIRKLISTFRIIARIEQHYIKSQELEGEREGGGYCFPRLHHRVVVVVVYCTYMKLT